MYQNIQAMKKILKATLCNVDDKLTYLELKSNY